MTKRITNIVDKFKSKLTGYKVRDLDFDGVKINNVKVDKLVTTFNYFDSDLTNGITFDDEMMSGRNGGRDNSDSNSSESDSNETGSDSNESFRRNSDSSESDSDSNESRRRDSDSNETSSDSDSNESDFNRRGGDFKRVGEYKRRGNDYKRRGGDYKRHGDDIKRRGGDNNRRDRDFKRHNGYKTHSDSDSDSDSNESMGRRDDKYMNKNSYKKWNYKNGNHGYTRNHQSRQVNYYNRVDKYDRDFDFFTGRRIVGRTRRLDTKQFTVTVDVDSRKTTNGIVRIFLGPRINNKQQLNDNRHNFVEIDQFIVKLNQGQNFIKRNSRDFKNVVGEPETMETLYKRALYTMKNVNKNGNGNDMYNLNIDTNNNNRGFPHRLILPKGTVGGEDYTLFVIVSDLKYHNENVQYRDNMNTFNVNRYDRRNDVNSKSDSDSDSNESNQSNDSNFSSSSDSNESFDRRGDRNDRMIRDNRKEDRYGYRNEDQMDRYGNRMERKGDRMYRNGYQNRDRMDRNDDRKMNDGRGNWEKKDGVLMHNFNNQNKNCGNGNGVLDTRAMGFPLDRQINDFNGFITKNMFFKDVTVYHIDNSNDY